MAKKQQYTRDKIIIFILLALATLVRLVVLLNTENFAGNVTMGRVTGALCILRDASLRYNFDGNTSVLYQYLLAAALGIWHDPLITPRIVSMIFGILLIVPFYFLIKALFNYKTALYSAILLALSPLHVIHSTLSLSDVIFHFFLFSCIYFLIKFKQKRRISWLILSVVCLNITSMLRFESWIFILPLAAFLYLHDRRCSIVFFFSSLVLPLLWLYLCYHYTGDTFYSFSTALKTAQTEIILRAPHSKQVFAWLSILYKTIGSVVFISGICGIVYSFFTKRFLFIAMLFIYQLAFYTINTMASRMWLVERYAILLGLLLLPYSVLFIERLSGWFRVKPVIFLLPFLFLSTFEFKQIAISRLPKFPSGVKEVGEWLRGNTLPTDKLILTADRWDLIDQDIIVRSGVYPRNVFVASIPLASPDPNLVERIKGYIATEKPRYLILSSTSLLEKIIGLDMNQKEYIEFGHTLELVYSQTSNYSEIGKMNIYKIIY